MLIGRPRRSSLVAAPRRRPRWPLAVRLMYRSLGVVSDKIAQLAPLRTNGKYYYYYDDDDDDYYY